MKVNQNSHTQNMQFGMAIHSNANVNKILKSRIKSSAELQKLNAIIDKQAKNNKVDITLLANPDGKSLCANAYIAEANADVYKDADVFKQFSENCITKIFGGVVGFIEKVSKYADKQAAKLSKQDLNLGDVFDKITSK